MNYKYHLLKYKGPASRLTCPNCGKHHCFAPYVDSEDQIVGEEYGRCDHESSCGYVKYPPSETDWREHSYRRNQNNWMPRPKSIVRTKPITELEQGICTIPIDIVKRTVRTTQISDFVYFLLTFLDVDVVTRLIGEYCIGVTKSNDVIFYQIDSRGRCRTGKIMKYNRETGHRIKDENCPGKINWVHAIMKRKGILPDKWELTQCLFGEHLLKRYPEKIVCIVEAEKTAIIGAGLMPEYVWVAVGGKAQLGDKVEVLEGRTIIAFPDVDGYDKWVEKCAERPHLNIMVSDYLQKNASDEDRRMKIDIADVLIRWKSSSPSYVAPKPQDPPPNALNSDNPVKREIMKYISPEYLCEVDALIDDLDLELDGVTKMVSEEC